jgi:antitoxin (DNA-binding transcriptional repressor) of toxin-antitoxin stability system
MKTMTRTEFERDVSQLLDAVKDSSNSVLITSEGQPAFTVEIKPVVAVALERNAVLREQLRGAVIEFGHPTLPVALEDWKALR